MLDLLADRHLTYETPLAFEEVTRRLQKEIVRPTWIPFNDRPNLFEGKFANNRFRMVRLVTGRSKPATVIVGEVMRAGGGTRVQVRLRVHRGALVGCVIMLLIAIGLSVLVLPAAIAEDSVTQALFIPAVLILVYVAFAFVSRAEAQRVTTLLARLFEAEPKAEST